MKASAVLVILFFISSFSYAQTDPKVGMTYDIENKLYYKISNDKENLNIKIYKDEYAQKILTRGGIKIYINNEGKRDTLNTPNVLYPVYRYPKKDYEEIQVSEFLSVPDGAMSVFNEYGIIGESKIVLMEGKSLFSIDQSSFAGQIAIPLNLLNIEDGRALSIMVLLRGMRNFPMPAGKTMGKALNSSPEQEAFNLQMDNWIHSWIDYKLK